MDLQKRAVVSSLLMPGLGSACCRPALVVVRSDSYGFDGLSDLIDLIS